MQVQVIYAGIISNAIDSITNFLRDPVGNLMDSMYGVFNKCCATTLDLIGLTPKEFNNGVGWNKIQSIMPIFTAVALSMIVTFFLIGLFKESINIRQEMTVEQLLKIFVRLGVAEGVVMSTTAICEAICSSAGIFAKTIAGTFVDIEVPEGTREVIRSLDFGEALVAVIVGAMLFIVAVVLGVSMLYTVYSRIFKILLIIPLGALAFATLSGGSGLNNSAIAFIKTFLGYAGEVIVMAIAITLSSAIINGGFSFGYTDGSALVKVMLSMLEAIFSFALVAAAVKGAETTFKRALGL